MFPYQHKSIRLLVRYTLWSNIVILRFTGFYIEDNMIFTQVNNGGNL